MASGRLLYQGGTYCVQSLSLCAGGTVNAFDTPKNLINQGGYFAKQLESVGFEACPGHPHFFKCGRVALESHMDDFHMAGLSLYMEDTWKQLKTNIDLEDPSPFSGTIYLGMGWL